MPAFIPLTDSLTGEPVVVNAAQIRCMSERKTSTGYTTVIHLESTSFLQVSEDILTVYRKLIGIGCICSPTPADLGRE